MAKTEPTARSLDALVAAPVVIATFKPGKSALGHHWTVSDGEGNELLRTKRVHSGGAVSRALWKSVTATGLDSGNDIHAELHGSGNKLLARASSLTAAPRRVTVDDASGYALGRLRHEDGRLTLEQGDPFRAFALVVLDGDGPWPVATPDGKQLGELVAGLPGPSTTPSWDELIFPVAPTNSGDFARTMHLGIRRVMQYTLVRTAADGGPFQPGRQGSVSPLVGLLPLLAGLVY